MEGEKYYNQSLKSFYIKEMENDQTNHNMNTITRVLKNVKQHEEFLGKDASAWTTREIIAYLKLLGSSSATNIRLVYTELKRYTEFCLDHGYIEKENNYDLIPPEVVAGCVNISKLSKTRIKRDELLDAIQDMNPCDKFLILGNFEGINCFGKENEEMLNAKVSDISGNTMKLCTGRTIQVSDELINFAHAAEEEYMYYTHALDYYLEPIPDIIIKPRRGRSKLGLTALLNRIGKNMEAAGYPKINARALQTSGRFRMITSECEKYNVDAKDLILSEELSKDLFNQYGSIHRSNLRQLLNEYNEYLK